MKKTLVWFAGMASAIILVALPFTQAVADDDRPPPDRVIKYSPYPKQTFPNRVYFGDTHLHTSYSTDAGMIGNRLGPDQAYRFARGETVTSSTGLETKLARPLDFLVISEPCREPGACAGDHGIHSRLAGASVGQGTA